MSVRKRTELAISCDHKAGELARVLEAISEVGVNVLAFCGWGHGNHATILLVPDDDAKAIGALKAAKVAFEKRTVVAVTSGSGRGVGARLARLLGDARINVEYAYASTSGTDESTAVFAVEHVGKALKILEA